MAVLRRRELSPPRRILALFAAVAAAVTTLAACSSSTDGEPAAVTTLNHTVTTTVTATVTATATATPPAPDFGSFARVWSGHTRSVDISPSGVMTEFVSSGCCDLALVVVLQLSHPTGSGSTAAADAEVLSVYSEDPTTAPKQGATGTVTIANGIMTDSLDQVTYCDEAVPAAAGQCGA